MQQVIRSTIIQSMITIIRERVLPASGEVVARIGQEVTPIQVVARMPQNLDFHILPIAEQLNLSKEELDKHLLVEEGADVQAGSELVGKRGLFRKPVTSPVDGEVYRIQEGRIILQRTTGWIELRAMIPGRVVELIPGRGVVIQTKGAQIQAVWGSGKEASGAVKIAGDRDEALTAAHFSIETAKNLLVAGYINDQQALDAAANNKVGGLIVGSIKAHLLEAARHMPFPIIITDGIGQLPMALPIYEILSAREEQEAALFGAPFTSRNGQCEIIIPSEDSEKVDSPTAIEPITIGSKVRVSRAPYQSQVGEVIKLYERMRTTELGTRAHGVEVRLADGREVFVPYANLDAIR